MLYLFKTIFKIYLSSLIFFCAVSIFSASYADAYTAVIKSAKLNMRSSSKRGAKVVAVLSKGDKGVIIGGIDGPYVYADFNGKKGYLRNRPIYIKIIPSEVTKKKEVKAKDVKQRKKIIEKKIVKEKNILNRYRKKAKEIVNGLEEIDKSVNLAEKKLGSLKKDYFDINQKIRNQKKKITIVQKQIDELEPFVEKRLVSLYKMSRVGQMNLLFSAQSVVDFMKRQKALKNIIGSDLVMIEKYSNLRKEYLKLEDSFIKEKVRVEDLQKKISKYLRIKESEKEKKRMLLKEIREKENIKLALIESLKEFSKRLDEKIIELGKSEKTVNTKVSRSFESYKGLLNYPVKGKVIAIFGEGRTKNGRVYGYKNGVGILADLGEPVHSIFSGEVVFSDWFKGYGNMMIINHGKNYYTIYAHVQEFFKQKGDKVMKDEVIATIGETGAISGPVLHFELRHHGSPLNPLSWIKN